MMYHAYQAQVDWMGPLRSMSRAMGPAFAEGASCWGALPSARRFSAACEVFNLAEVTHQRRPFAIDSVKVGDDEVPVREEATAVTPFATLLHFAKETTIPQPRVLIVAPMSGHFATLLRETVRTMLRDHDVYITDWHNAREVPVSEGRFGLDEYADHVMQFLGVMGPGSHLMAICQPCVASLAAVAIMSEDDNPAVPLSMTLMAGPIDCRISPTVVNTLANDKPIEWFEKNLISRVPLRHAGGGRRVYPGFLQLTAFMSMNKERHIAAFKEMYEALLKKDDAKVEATRSFYEEYFAVSDLPAEFYLETVEKIFQTYELPRGELRYRDRVVNPASIRRTALLTVEGERDDICSLGQTMAAQDLCSGLRPYMRTHYVQAAVGHYGTFSGKRWNNQIYPVVRNVVQVSQ